MILFGTFTGDIAAAICLGVLTDVLIKVLTGDAKKVHPVLYVLCIPAGAVLHRVNNRITSQLSGIPG